MIYFFMKLIPKADTEEAWEMQTIPELHQAANHQMRPVQTYSPDLTHQESSPLKYIRAVHMAQVRWRFPTIC